MTSLTVPLAVLIFVTAVTTRNLLVPLALSGITSAGAAVVLGDIAVPTFYAVALSLLAIAVLRRLGQPSDSLPIPKLFPLLIAFLIYCVGITLLAPFFFPGQPVVSETTPELVPGSLSTSNLAQILYLVLGLFVTYSIAMDRRASVGLLGIISIGGVALSLWRYLSVSFGLLYPMGLFDNSPAFVFIESSQGGAMRFRGIFSEPAALSSACLVMVAYGCSRAVYARSAARYFLIAMVGVAVLLGIASTSTSFVVAGVVLLLVATIAFCFGLLARVTQPSKSIVVLACLLVAATAFLLPSIAEFVARTVQDKVTTDSFSERSGADAGSYQVFLDTWGLGAGLGASRGSSLLPTLLSTVGLFGVLCFVGAISASVVGAARTPAVRPAIWVISALLISKSVSGPDLTDTSGVQWIALGLLIGATYRAYIQRQEHTLDSSASTRSQRKLNPYT